VRQKPEVAWKEIIARNWMQTGPFMPARLVRLVKRAMPDSKPLPYVKPPQSLPLLAARSREKWVMECE
jgi:hypothetical protein